MQATALRHLRWVVLLNPHIMRPILSFSTNGEPRISKVTYLTRGQPAVKFQNWIETRLSFTPTWSSFRCVTVPRIWGSVQAGWLRGWAQAVRARPQFVSPLHLLAFCYPRGQCTLTQAGPGEESQESVASAGQYRSISMSRETRPTTCLSSDSGSWAHLWSLEATHCMIPALVPRSKS